MKKSLIIASIFCAQVLAQIGVGQSSLFPQQSSGASSAPITPITTNFSLQVDEMRQLAHSATDLFVDENTYYLGNGDILRAIIWGTTETVLDIPVVNETCIIPTVGALDVGVITLAEAREKIISMIRRKYRAERIDLFLMRGKELVVPIQGQVNNSGTHLIPGNWSVATILENIGGTNANANLREIQLVNPRHGTRVVDLVRANRIANYPETFLRSGDRIFVPRRDLRASISGAVQFEGDYDFVAGDKLSDLLQLSGGMLSSADSSRIVVTRFTGQRDEIKRITLTADEAENFALEKDDLVLISRKAEYRPIRRVRISGEVNFPGLYSIQQNQTRLIDIIEQAGGLTEQANLNASRIIRRNFVDPAGSERERLQNAPSRVQITPIENNFLKAEAGGKTQMSIDFSSLRLDRNSVENVVLRDGDEIHIEKIDWTVNVIGGVLRPGLVEYSSGQDLSYYIERAGGLKENAKRRKIRVIKAGSNVWLKPNQVDRIERGDAIWIPERDFVERREREQRVGIVGGIIGIVGGIATTIITTNAIIEMGRR